MDVKEVGNKITTIRKEKGWTQKEIAEKLHVSTAAVSKWERGLNYPDLSLMESLAEVLGISVAELLGVADEPKDNIIKNITEISKEEKEREIFGIRKKAMLMIGTVTVFWVVDIVWGLNYGSIVLLIGTLLFNGLSWCLNREK